VTRAPSARSSSIRKSDIVFVAALGHPFGPNRSANLSHARWGKTGKRSLQGRKHRRHRCGLRSTHSNILLLRCGKFAVHRGASPAAARAADSIDPATVEPRGRDWKTAIRTKAPKGLRSHRRFGGRQLGRVYALIQASEAASIALMIAARPAIVTSHSLIQRPWYYMHIIADHRIPRRVRPGRRRLPFHDGGEASTKSNCPRRQSRTVDRFEEHLPHDCSNDGAPRSRSTAARPEPAGQPAHAQFYHVIADTRILLHLRGPAGHSTIAIASRSDDGAIDRADWYQVGAGKRATLRPILPIQIYLCGRL